MKTTIKRTVEEEVDVTLPCYKKTSAHYVKIIDENSVIVVSRVCELSGIEFSDFNVSSWLDKHDSTEEEFTQNFNEVLLILSESILHQSKEKPYGL